MEKSFGHVSMLRKILEEVRNDEENNCIVMLHLFIDLLIRKGIHHSFFIYLSPSSVIIFPCPYPPLNHFVPSIHHLLHPAPSNQSVCNSIVSVYECFH